MNPFSLIPPPAPPVPEYPAFPPAPASPATAASSKTPGPGPSPELEEPGVPVVDFMGLWQAFRRLWWIPMLTAAIVMGAAGAWLYNTPQFYTATAEVAVDQQKSTFLPGESFKPEDMKSLEVLKSIEREITSRALLLRVIHQHQLQNDPTFAAPKKSGQPYGDDEIVHLLRKRVSAGLERGTRHIVLAVDDTQAERARELCASILAEAMRRSREDTSGAAQSARRTLEAEKVRIEAGLAASQAAADAFRARFPGLPLDEIHSDVKTNTVEEILRSVSAAASAADAEVTRLENTVAQIVEAGGRTDALLRLPEIGGREEVTVLQRSLGEKEAAFVVIDAEFGPKHPRHQQAVKEIAETSSQLTSMLGRAVSSVQNQLEKARQDAAGMAAELERRKAENMEFQKVSGEFATLVSLLRAERANYDRVLNRLKEAEVNSALGDSVLRIVDEPLEPSSPSKPRRKLLTMAGGVLGFGAGIGLVLLLHLMDRSVRSIGAGEQLLRLPGLAALPADPVHELRDGLLHDRPGAAAQMEAFRALRTSLGIFGRGPAARSFLFTGIREGEGTSYTAMNFALSLARQGYRTLLIDANLRHPSLDRVFLKEPPAGGLADHLSGSGGTGDGACQRTAIPGIYLFAAGSTTSHPSEALNEQKFAVLLQDAARWFHKIVIDAPPVGQFTDALPLARHADSVCLVLRAGTTPREEARRAVRQLAMAGATPAGFVLSAAPVERGLQGAFRRAGGGGFSEAAFPAAPATALAGPVPAFAPAKSA